jgi:hypothetical protein
MAAFITTAVKSLKSSENRLFVVESLSLELEYQPFCCSVESPASRPGTLTLVPIGQETGRSLEQICNCLLKCYTIIYRLFNESVSSLDQWYSAWGMRKHPTEPPEPAQILTRDAGISETSSVTSLTGQNHIST